MFITNCDKATKGYLKIYALFYVKNGKPYYTDHNAIIVNINWQYKKTEFPKRKKSLKICDKDVKKYKNLTKVNL